MLNEIQNAVSIKKNPTMAVLLSNCMIARNIIISTNIPWR